MNGAAGKTNGNYLGIAEGVVPPAYGVSPASQMYMQNLIFTLHNLLGQLNQFSVSTSPQPMVHSPWSTPSLYPGTSPLTKMYYLSNLLGSIRTQIQALENNIAKQSVQNIQGTVEGLNLAAQSLQASQVLRRMDSIIDEIYKAAYQKQSGI